jgi:hypothetical protein
MLQRLSINEIWSLLVSLPDILKHAVKMCCKLDLRGRKQQESRRSCITKNFMICS